LGFFCTYASIASMPGYHRLPFLVPSYHPARSVPPRPHSHVLPARADHFPVGRPITGIDLKNTC
jgi:hypothetical protein